MALNTQYRKSQDYVALRGARFENDFKFAVDFYYEGFAETNEIYCFGEMYCIANEEFFKNGDNIITVYCWYKSKNFDVNKLTTNADVVAEIFSCEDESGCFPFFWVSNDALRSNAALNSYVVLDKLKAA